MNRQRLEQLREMVEGIPDSQLRMFSWVCLSDDLSKGRWATVADHGCGAICCAFGFAAQYPPFMEQGLSLELDPDVSILTPALKTENLIGYRAAAKFFDLTYSDVHAGSGEAWELFKPVSHKEGGETDKTVFLKRLDELLDPELIP